MVKKIKIISASLILTLLLITFSVAGAAVGNFTEVEGQVNRLKLGKPPAIAAKVQGEVEMKDIIQTKSLSRTQITFVDDTILTMAPESRVVIDQYFFDGVKSERRALLKVVKGLVKTVVGQFFQTPDYLMETPTSVIGVRGTEWYTLIKPSSTEIYLVHGRLEAGSNSPGISPRVQLGAMQYTQILRGQPPTPPRPFSATNLGVLQSMMKTGIQERLLLLTPPTIISLPPGVKVWETPDQQMQPTIPPMPFREGQPSVPVPAQPRHY
jgi:hypothetical protein